MKKSILLLKAFFLTVVMMVGSMSVMADNLAVWDPTDNGTGWVTELNVTSADANVTATEFVRGAGLVDFGSAAGWSFGGRCAVNTKASAIANEEYFSLTIQANEGYKMSLTGIPTWFTRKSGTGVLQIYVQYALNSGEFADAGDITITSTGAPGSNTPLTFSTAAQTALSDLPSTTTVTLRFVVVTSTEANLYIVTGNAANNTNRFVIAGTIVEDSSPSYTITAESNNQTYGTVSMQGNVITATPASCLYALATPAYTVTPTGAATVTQEGNEFTVEDLTDNVTVTINFMENPTPPAVYTVTFMDKNEQVGELQTDCDEIIIPETVPTSDCANWVFAGWAETEEITTTPVLYLPNTAFTPSSNTTLYAVFKFAKEFAASLTQAEILGSGQDGGYADRTIASASGNWTGWFSITSNSAPAFLQINTGGTGAAVGSHILSPAFEGIVSSIEVHFMNENTTTRTIRIMDVDDNLLSSYVIPAQTVGSYTFMNLDINNISQFKIFSATSAGALRITGVNVIYKEEDIYNSNPNCTPTINVDLETLELDFGSVTIGETSTGKTIEVSGVYLFDDILYDKGGDDASAFTVEETSWDPTDGGTLTITFSPTEEREYSATLIISSQDAEDVIITLTGTGIGTTSCKEVSASAVFGYSMNNNIYLNNLPEDSYIYVYSAAGQLIASQKSDVSEVILSAVQKGSLIVKIVSGTNAQTLKIFNK